MNKNRSIDSAINVWKENHDKIAYIDNWIGAVGSAILFMACLIALVFVLKVNKRKEPFLIVTTVLFALYSGLSVPYYLLEIMLDRDEVAILTISIFFAALAHWVFTVQYLKTSLILPVTLREAKLEWLHEAQNHSQALNPLDMQKLNDELEAFGHDSGRNSLTQTFKKFDEVIDSLKRQVSR